MMRANRVAKDLCGVTIISGRRSQPHRYAQVLEKVAAPFRVYTYGLNRISQSQASGTSLWENSNLALM